VLPTHVTVVGAAGSGKSWLAKVLAEEAVLQGISVLAVDPQGDLVQFLRQRDPATFGEEQRRRFERFRQVVEPRVLTPGSSHGIRVSLSPIRLAAAAELVGETDPRRRAEELEGMLATVASNLVRLAKSGGEIDSQQTFVLQVLKRLTAEGGGCTLRLADVVVGITRPDELGVEDADAFIRKSEREKLGRKLNNLLHGPSANLFEGGLPLDVEQLCKPVTPGRVPLNVVYLNALADDDQKQCFVAALAAELYRWMVTSANPDGRPRLLFYLDEARDYIPAGAAKPAAKMPLIRLFAQGRKYGVACLLCTQSPRSVDYNVFGNCSTKLIGRLESAQDVGRVAEWFAPQGPAPAWLRGRTAAAPGTFVARWPQMPPGLEGQAIKSRFLFSLHEGAWSPDRVEQEMRGDPTRQALQSRSAAHAT
jgi:DNA helicase HerA-like ATPase